MNKKILFMSAAYGAPFAGSTTQALTAKLVEEVAHTIGQAQWYGLLPGNLRPAFAYVLKLHYLVEVNTLHL